MSDLPVVLSHYQTRSLKDTFVAGISHIELSLDLGISAVSVELSQSGVHFPHGEVLSWDAVATISAAENSCFIIQQGEPQKLLLFSEHTDQVYSLMPTSGAPTMLVSGIPMHRIKGTDPHRDTLEKIKSIRPVAGRVLDTATGLGYTAIEASRTAVHVTTIELEPAVLEIARLNPWSRMLFNNPKVSQLLGDSFDVVNTLQSTSFSRIIHDPPAFALAGHLYSIDFYRELNRVLQRSGRLYHYIGNPESKSGRSVTRGVMRRLREAGFTKVAAYPRAFGVVAYK